MARVAVIGELNVDLLAIGLNSLPQMGHEIVAQEVAMTLGSASAIFSVGATRLGHPVTFIGQVGADKFGDFCLEELRAAGLAHRQVTRTSKARTGVTISLSGKQDRALVTYPGAIASFGYDALDMSILKGHQHLHMTSYFLQNALRKDFPRIFRQARKMGLTTSFDPNSDPTSAWSQTIRAVLRHTDVLLVNEAEALHLSGARGVRSALKTLGQFVPCVVIKRGHRGAIAIKGDEVISEPGFKVNGIDTTGAGDSFAAGFVSAYLRRLSLTECLRRGNACGALSTLKPGGTAGQPDEKGLRKFLRSAASQSSRQTWM